MKKLAILIMTFAFLACGKKETVEKPEKLLSESDMVNILYDLTLLQAANSYSPKTLADAGVDSKTYIYEKYKTDSLNFAQSHKYYASDLDRYESIQNKVSDRVKKNKAAVDAQFKKENPSKEGKDLKTDTIMKKQ